MPTQLRKSTESRKSRSHSGRPVKKPERRRSSKKRSVSAKATKSEVDILSPAAMQNVYYISHNAVDCLEFRGFGWPESTKKKTGGMKGKKPKNKK
ncbi:small lysine-rich protein 1 isoform X2 [Coregonus clupeaformis]|uniref:small lysine-rich protein 1 isoform X2 n=1 Tax=Coregonus clupeaformis TaxID=59861 RepID=UPI001BE0F491|nr:small lysine-rich protein 1 isoform X2 [Coregonus clupeaformis]XP_041709727.1 small lysine-rich protein 1 isoform X2 [Coregonus clupeaformis]